MKFSLTVPLGVLCFLQYAAGANITLGSIQGQDGWSGGKTIDISTSVDQGVTNATAYNSVQSLRVSNNAYNSMFDGWIFGPGLANAAGQPSSGAPADRIALSLLFRSVNAFADGSNLELDLGNVTGDDRTTFTAITNFADSNGGLTLRAAEPDPSGAFFPSSLVSPGLSRTAWHTLDILGVYLDGPANDYFQISLDGGAPIVSPNTGLNQWATFEAFNAAVPQGYNLSNRLYMRSGYAPSDLGFTSGAAGGFYIDNVSYKTWNSTDSSTILSSYSTGFENASAVSEPGTAGFILGGSLSILLGSIGRRKLCAR